MVVKMYFRNMARGCIAFLQSIPSLYAQSTLNKCCVRFFFCPPYSLPVLGKTRINMVFEGDRMQVCSQGIIKLQHRIKKSLAQEAAPEYSDRVTEQITRSNAYQINYCNIQLLKNNVGPKIKLWKAYSYAYFKYLGAVEKLCVVLIGVLCY